ncbi:MAG: hypothetical protein J6C06_01810 [Lachnospiraceae bacterium]|nr:hypothetical protein [Lachnospiraceae bacterium]
MKLTKTWLSYIIWGIFSIIFFTNIGIAAIEIGIQNETTDFLMPMAILYGGTIVGILAFIGIYKLIEKYMLPKMKSEGEPPVLKGPGEWLAFAMLIFIAIAVRAIAIISAGGALAGTTEFYEYAIGNADSAVFEVHNNATYIYCGFLGFLLSFLGHFPTAAMSVQAGIQVITIIVTYFAVKKALGRVPAWISIALMSFLPGSFFAVRMCTPDSFLTMLFAFYMLALVYLGQANREQKIRIGAHSVFYVLMGLFAGVLTYLDWTGLLAFVIGIVALVQYKNEDAWLKIQRPFLQVLWFSIAFVLTTLLLLWFLPTGGMESGPAAVLGYASVLLPHGGLNLMILSPHKGQWDTLALFIFAGLWFCGFLRNKQDKAFPYTFSIAFLTIASFVGIGAYDYDLMASYLWIMLATIGLTSINDFRKNERDVAVAEKTKENTAKRKAERERKRAEAAGEKSIRLDDIHEKKSKGFPSDNESGGIGYSPARTSNSSVGQTNAYNDSSTKKGYGIGRKTESFIVEEPTNNMMSTVEEKSSNVAASVVSTPTYSGVETEEKYSVVKKVDRPPLGMPSSLTPMQPQYGYAPGSRSRRSLRSPSKSTFTPEDLERISRYTGVNYMASQTVSVKQEEPEIVENNVDNVIETSVSSDNVAETNIISDNVIETPVTNHLSSISKNDIVVAQENVVIDVTEERVLASETTETVIQAVEESVDILEDNAETSPETVEHSVSYIELDAMENEEVNHIPKETAVVDEVPTLAPYVSPSRRHFRHPSKSTFSPEELEKISQYTGVSYKKTEQTPLSPEKENERPLDEKTNASAQKVVRSEKSSVQPEKALLQSEKTVTKPMQETKTVALDNAKSVTERKPKMIRNPLPGPKPHVAKELSYDYNPKPSEMEFDIVDLKGKDFFDL